ncbi:sugar ABC transporter ATP-binding protein [Paenibacillus naphthalenovorans]|uniref:sugar ABC transporter ATP-binding protein n=1 Tax=Paenibacillus naphthalenovorans TaxID=162209 RepID=UPI000886A93F|nr:sugar ABC transporter ATP-binding protein [Paenibacillus naphthalenovorans]SDI92750.1 ribose transport system ATP-binding protein/rhamnose transport system ATP-binding protein [Paenibacillus naphthalenovorans]
MAEVLRVEQITKQYPGVLALDDVSFDVQSGEVHTLLGENGAGKSTLIKVIAGIITPNYGKIFVQNEEVHFDSPLDAIRSGISTAFQEEALFHELSVAENIFMGQIPSHMGKINKSLMIERSADLLKQVGLDTVHPDIPVKHLNIATRQLVQLARAFLNNARVLILDEPATALTPHEREKLFQVVQKFKDQGAGIVFVSHHLKEALSISDRITVLKDGRKVTTTPAEGINEKQIVHWMVGKEIGDIYPAKEVRKGSKVVYEVKGLSLLPHFSDVGFQLHEGEILGIAGLMGCGKTELAQALFGRMEPDRGLIKINGEETRVHNTKAAIDKGIFLIPDNRNEALYLSKSICENVSLPAIRNYSNGVRINRKKETEDVEELAGRLKVRAVNVDYHVDTLSGGNRQKVLIARGVFAQAKILIFVEPTLGVDVGARSEIYDLIADLSRNGQSIIVISSDVPEIVGISHRVLVMHQGELKANLEGDEISEFQILNYMVSHQEEASRMELTLN